MLGVVRGRTGSESVGMEKSADSIGWECAISIMGMGMQKGNGNQESIGKSNGKYNHIIILSYYQDPGTRIQESRNRRIPDPRSFDPMTLHFVDLID